MRAIADTSFVVALENKRDVHRQRSLSVYKTESVIYLPQSVLNEVCYLLTKEGGNRVTVAFLQRLPTMKYILLPLDLDDISRTTQILTQYTDSRLDFVDATIAAVAERLQITRILTLDCRDFQLLRPNHTAFFEILP